MNKLLRLVQIGTATLIFASLSTHAVDGPFPTVTTRVAPFQFKLEFKLEAPTSITFPCTMQGSSTGTVTTVDPTTGIKTTKPTSFSDGQAITGSEGYTLPKGATVIRDATSKDPMSIGRYAYVGDVPRFETSNIEMFASKMGHSLRVKTWVTQDLIDHYEQTLILRWKDRYDGFTRPTVHLFPLKNLAKMATDTKDLAAKKLYQAASYYSTHYLENADPAMNIYDQTADEATYRDRFLTELLRKNLSNDSLNIQDGLNLANQYLTNPAFVQTRTAQAEALFQEHMGSRFTSAADAATGRVGYLTFVYPIAIDKDGPFHLPSPGLRHFPLAGSIEARMWSGRWEDEFGGFPFLLITDDGVAFHGPITLNSDLWFLRRANVSHSCMRMDPSDILELRHLFPKNIMALEGLHQTAPLEIMEWPDVTDLNNDGNFSVMDVGYYLTQASGNGIIFPANWKPNLIKKSFWNQTFAPFAGKLPSKNTFSISAHPKDGDPGYDGVFTGLPQYSIQNGQLVQTGYYTQEIHIKTMPMRPTAIVQYKEDGVVFDGTYLQTNNDNRGQLPPTKFEHGN